MSGQYATAQVGCMPTATDPHRSQLISPYNHRRLEFALSYARMQNGATQIWVGCDDADGNNIWFDR